MKLCMGCMREVEENTTACPYCGFDEAVLSQESYYLAPGSIIGGKYIVGRVLKYGGYTVKYIGMDAELNRKVTISEYLPSDYATRSEGESEVTIYSGDAMEQFNEGLMTFLNEGNQIRQLGNVKGIAQVYDCISENDTGYVISEYLEGQTLQEILDTGKRYQPEEARALICEILSGLSQLHPKDIIHCDIAPETILVTRDGRVKLLDFGAVRYVTTANSKSLAIILKQGYAPEEQYRSQGQRGPWTDVYALGAVMYRMITGKVPPESVDRTLEDTLVEPSKLGIHISTGMQTALMNALNVYQQERTQSADGFYRELVSGNAQRIKVKRKKKETGKMPLWMKGFVAVVACAVIGGGVFAWHQMGQEDGQAVSQDVLPALTGCSVEEFKERWENAGLKFDEVEVEYCYDTENVKAGEEKVEIYKDKTDGILEPGTPVSKIKDWLSKETDSEKEVKAEIVVASSKHMTFNEEWLENCPYMGKGEEIYSYANPCCKQVLEGDESQPYGKIAEIKDNEIIIYKYDKDKTKCINTIDLHKAYDVDKFVVTIFTGSYYWREKGEKIRIGDKLDEVWFQYGKKNQGKPERKNLEESHYEKYIGIGNKYCRNYIVDIKSDNLKKGNAFDAKAESLDKILGVIVSNPLLEKYGNESNNIMGEITIGQLKNEYADYADIKWEYGNAEDDWIVDVNEIKRIDEAGKKVEPYFKKDDKNVRIYVKASPKLTPKPTFTPTPSTESIRTQKPESSKPTTKPSDSDGDGYGM